MFAQTQKLGALLLLAMFSVALPAQDYIAGKDFLQLPTPQADGGEQIEVIEFFSYACPHCNKFAPQIDNWKKALPANVKLTKVPAVFRTSWEPLAKAYYALETIGEVDKAHLAIFAAVHKQKRNLETDEQLADVVASAGVDREKFLKAMRSFSVSVKLKRSAQLFRAYQVRGVPSVAVNGQYLVSTQQAGNFSRMTKIMDYLVAAEAERNSIALQ